ncbi:MULTISPECIES: hypothetical protein [unclassified Streptomyces]|uniref:hypothetical protein n=1 Tax=unclassified Streptomyces TaxID=2593676 RepID=UPI000C271404|nr:hypothetical protein [Streptomyces sp. CB02959]PJN34419.1 hypothetical protein CG747_40330 [Streptomyces sp. CB02959]
MGNGWGLRRMFSRKAGSKAGSPDGRLGFSLVRRGYDREQVEAYVERSSPAGPPAEPPAFDVARRGYDRQEVDAYIEELRARRRP